MEKTILITGGAGFIGSALIRLLSSERPHYKIINVDCLTYASSLESLAEVEDLPSYKLEKVNICDRDIVNNLFSKYKPTGIIHLAAESHVDRSIDEPNKFIQTNINGTFNLLEAAKEFWTSLPKMKKLDFRFHHVSTDEVFGTLGAKGMFSETSPYAPRSPYSSSKASSDMLVQAWNHTYGLPTLITNTSNNYGPFQFPEKLIPKMILRAIEEKSLPIYDKGKNIRDWLHVEDHARALLTVYEYGKPGNTYNIGGRCEKTNIDVVKQICLILDEIIPPKKTKSRNNLIDFVQDRPGHDYRYAIDPTKIETELGWKPEIEFESGLRATVEWYIRHKTEWCTNRFHSVKGQL